MSECKTIIVPTWLWGGLTWVGAVFFCFKLLGWRFDFTTLFAWVLVFFFAIIGLLVVIAVGVFRKKATGDSGEEGRL
jgi:hypothetical protein